VRVIAARRCGADRIILLGCHPGRIALGKEFGATDIVSERGDAAVERVRALTGGFGAHSVLECVGHQEAMLTAMEIARPGGAIGRVGVPQEDSIPVGPTFWKNVSVAGGPALASSTLRQWCAMMTAGSAACATSRLGP
jgi:threonine dehydrogenase-like Zn-dependent dehydrogenase